MKQVKPVNVLWQTSELLFINGELSVVAELIPRLFVCFSVAFLGARRNVRLRSMREDKTTSVVFDEIFQRASEETRYLQPLSGKTFIAAFLNVNERIFDATLAEFFSFKSVGYTQCKVIFRMGM